MTTYYPQLFLKCDDDAATATVIESSGLGRNGSLSSGTTSALHTTGKLGSGFTGLGTTQYASNFGGYKCTGKRAFLAVWLKNSSAPGATSLMILCQNLASLELYTYSTSGTLVELSVNYHHATISVSDSSIWDGNWHLICASYDGYAASNQIRIWFDNTEGTPYNGETGDIPSSTETFGFGDACNGLRSYPGAFDGIRVYNNVPDSDVAALVSWIWNSGSGTDDPPVVPVSIDPIFSLAPLGGGTKVTAGNTASDGSGTIGTDIFIAASPLSATGHYISKLLWTPTASAVATTTYPTTARIFISTQDSGATTSADTWLFQEISLPAVVASSSTSRANYFEVTLNISLPSSCIVLVTNHVTPAANTCWCVTAFGGDYFEIPV